ncbi:MAG: Fic family protein [Pseudobdellovibrionaceae bacterium]
MSSSEISKKTGLLKRSTLRLISGLLDEKILVKQGQARNTIYKLNELLPVGYNNFFLKNLVSTNIFTKNELKKIDLLGKRTGETIELETYNSKIYERLIIDLSWSSSHLEGNTYSILETEQLILKNIEGENKNLAETQMILNHKEAIKFITFNKKSIGLNAYTIKSVHALLSENLISNSSAQGRIRNIPVGIEGTRYLPLDIPQKIETEFESLLIEIKKIKNPITQAFILFVFLPYLQPFEDLNKRTSRVCCNVPLLIENYVPISFLNIERDEYLTALKAVYEFNRIDEMKTVFLKAYKYSVEKYRFIKQTIRTPTKFEIKFRAEIKESVHNCVKNKVDPKKLRFPGLTKLERDQLRQIIFSELTTLHEENLIRFNLKLSEFKNWKQYRRK